MGDKNSDGEANLSRAVITAVADAEGVDPSELDPPLNDAIDGDALNALFAATNGGTGWVRFQYGDYVVTVSDGSHVELEESCMAHADD